MKRLVKRLVICFLAAVFVWFGSVVADRQRLNEDLIRLHIVANSNDAEDQDRKLAVRDAISDSLRQNLEMISDVSAAKEYILQSLPKIQNIAQETLLSLGSTDSVTVSLGKEAFDTRVYETFTLPAGVYDALRIVIGEGEGKNWWCVVFPSLCVPTSSGDFTQVAAGAGFSTSLQDALTRENNSEIRFYLLDILGKMENRFLLD